MFFSSKNRSLRKLKKYAKKYNCDKRFLGYLDKYNDHFYKQRLNNKNILEIGVKRKTKESPGASSLKMWKKYFPNSIINGIDIDPINKSYEENRIRIFTGDQGDESFLNTVIKKTGNFDIVIDDGSHINELTIRSYNYLFQKLNPGGLYIIEDLLCSYMNLDEHNIVEKSIKSEKSEDGEYGTWWGMHLIKDTSFKNNRSDIDNFIKSKVYDLDLWKDQISESKRGRIEKLYLDRKMDKIEQIIFYKWMILIKKAI